MLTSSPNRRQKGCIPPRVLNVLFICIHALCCHGNPNQIHWPVQLCLIFSSLFWFHHWAPMLTHTKINRDGARTQPNLREFILSLRPVRSMTLFRHPSHFSQLENWKMLSVCEAEETGAVVWVGSAHLRHNAPNSFRAACSFARLTTCQSQRWGSSKKVWPLGAVKIHYLSVYTLSPLPEINKFYHSLSYTHSITHTHIEEKSGDASEMSPKTHINAPACKTTLCSLN